MGNISKKSCGGPGWGRKEKKGDRVKGQKRGRARLGQEQKKRKLKDPGREGRNSIPGRKEKKKVLPLLMEKRRKPRGEKKVDVASVRQKGEISKPPARRAGPMKKKKKRKRRGEELARRAVKRRGVSLSFPLTRGEPPQCLTGKDSLGKKGRGKRVSLI